MAAEDYINMDMWDDDRWPGGGDNADPLYYHHMIHFTALVSETKRAYLLDIPELGDVWVPKSICREMDRICRRVMVHSKTFKSITSPASKKDLEF